MRQTTADLVARAERIDGRPDLLRHFVPDDGVFFEHPGRAFVTIGAAQTIGIPAGAGLVARAAKAAREALGRIHGAGPIPPFVVGALPFGEATPATLTIPRVAFVRGEDGATWRVTVGSEADVSDADVPSLSKATLKVSAVPDPSAYVAAVAAARARIRAGELEKVVLARLLIAQSDHEFDRRALLARLRANEPDAYTFAAGGFIGASPELLVARTGDRVRARPLAGTAARGRDTASDDAAGRALLASAKDRGEHALVVDAVRAALEPVCARLDMDPAPGLLATSKVWHLATELRGTLAERLDALSLAARLHPTPAVCGTPRDAARAAITELEQIERTLYAGLVGWTDATGDGEWAVVLRCAEMQGRIALLFAGAGVVADSDPEAELAETDAKFRSMLEALGYA
ncbi:MAG: isochorismate synthase [Actinomycetota bacterium]